MNKRLSLVFENNKWKALRSAAPTNEPLEVSQTDECTTIHIRKSLTQPLHLIHKISGQGPASSALEVVLDEGCRAQVFSGLFFEDSSKAKQGAEILYKLQPQSQLHLAHWQGHGKTAESTVKTTIHLQKDSLFDSVWLSPGSTNSRQSISAHLNESGSEARLRGVFHLKDKDRESIEVLAHHKAPHSQSQIQFRGIADGHSTGWFRGCVTMDADAQKCNSHQENKNLLLSKSAKIRTKPELMVHADDVKATHGATVGELDSQQLFYLMSRGIPEKQSRELLVSGFYEELLYSGLQASATNWLKNQHQHQKEWF